MDMNYPTNNNGLVPANSQGTTIGEIANNVISNLSADINCAAERAISGIGWLTTEQEEKLLKCEVSMDAKYPDNQFYFEIDGYKFLTSSDLHTIGAKQKGGKTSLISILLAAILCGQWGRVRCLVSDMTVLYVDTEMKPVDTQMLGMKAAKMARVDTSILSQRIHLVNFRPLSPSEMEEGIRYFIQKYKPMLVVIDGIVDLCANFNDVEASQNLVLNFLMKMAEEHNCAIVNVLHTNKTDNYTELRGHLGAFFEQKGVTVIKCEKDDKSNIVTVKFPTHRYAPVPDFHFGFDDQGVPVPADEQYDALEMIKLKVKNDAKAEERQKVIEQRQSVIISILNENGESMKRKQLVEEAMKRLKKSESTIKGLIAKMKSGPTPAIEEEKGVITLLVF